MDERKRPRGFSKFDSLMRKLVKVSPQMHSWEWRERSRAWVCVECGEVFTGRAKSRPAYGCKWRNLK